MSISKAVWTQRLDAAGDFSAELALTDPQTAALVSGRIYRHYQEGRGFCFAGSIESENKTPPEELSLAGDSLLVELLYDNTLIGKEYADTSVNDIIDDLLDGTAWTRLGSIPDLISVRFDGESKLRAILAVVDMVGQHIRERVEEASGSLVRQLEIGPFGAVSGVVVSNGSVNDLAISDEGLAVIPEGEFSVEETTTEVWNWVLPLGAGEGVSQLTLVQQTRLPNLITTNPSFEAGLEDWTPVLGPVSDASRSVHGKHCVRISTSGFLNNAGVYRDIPIAVGATYRAEAWTWKEDGAHSDWLYAEFRSASHVVLAQFSAVNDDVTGRWVRLDTGDMAAPEGALYLRLYLLNVALTDHTSYFDLPRVWRVASDVGAPYDVLTELTTPTDLFPQINWHISDPASIALHGRRQRPLVAKDIVPLSHTKPAFQAAANALYDLASAQLDRWKLRQNAYRLGAVGLTPSVLPGDTVRLRYKGMMQRDAGDVLPSTYPAVVLEDAPSAYYRMGEASGNIQDSSGNALHGSVVGPTPVYAQPGALAGSDTAILLAGGAYFDVPDDPLLDPGDVFTLEAWVIRGAAGALQTIFSKGANGYAFGFTSTNTLRLFKDYVSVIAASTITISADGLYHHVVATKSGATVKIYIDGVDVTGGVTNSTITATALALRIGRRTGGEESMNGTLDELAIYPTALSAARVLAHYAAGREAGSVDERYMYVDVDQDLYVLERQTTWEDISKDTLLVSDLDRQLQNDDEVVIGKLEDTARAFRTHVQTGIGVWAEHLGPEEVDATHPFTFNARIPDNIVQLLRLLCTITPRAIRSPVDVAANAGATVGSTASGGSSAPASSSGGSQTPTTQSGGSAAPTSQSAPHVHDIGLMGAAAEAWYDPIWMRRIVLQQPSGGVPFFLATDDFAAGVGGLFNTLPDSTPHTHVVTIAGHTHTVAIVAHTHTVSIPAHTHSVTIPNHDHALDFGIFEGSSAAGIGITIDGVSRTSELGGPWSSPATLDLTRYFLDDDGVVVQGDHTVILSSSQLGRIETRLEWAVTAAALRV